MALIDGLISYFECNDDAANTTVVDVHGSNTGTSQVNTSAMSVNGVIDKGLNFSTSNERIEASNTDFKSLQSFSVSKWIKRDGVSSGTFPRFFLNGTVNSSITITQDSNSQNILFRISDGSPQNLITTGNFLTSSYNHFVFTYDGSTMKVYKNAGTPQTNSISITINTASGSNIFIGGENLANTNFNGDIDETGIWNRALSASEISELYNSGAGLAYPFAAATLRLIKISGTFQAKPILTKVAGSFVDKPIKIKVGGIFQDA